MKTDMQVMEWYNESHRDEIIIGVDPWVISGYRAGLSQKYSDAFVALKNDEGGLRAIFDHFLIRRYVRAFAIGHLEAVFQRDDLIRQKRNPIESPKTITINVSVSPLDTDAFAKELAQKIEEAMNNLQKRS